MEEEGRAARRESSKGKVHQFRPPTAGRQRSAEEVTLYLQHREDRSRTQRVVATTDSNGDLEQAVFYTDGKVAGRDSHVAGFFRRLCEVLADSGWQLVHPAAWHELPAELWGTVMRIFTAREGKALACTCKMINNITRLESFMWEPALLHLAMMAAQEAVRSDTATHLPVNITETEVRIGRSRNNDVVLLRDPEVSKQHCRLWRDARGDVFVQDLASTNGTWLNGETLRPPGSGREPGDRTPSKPLKLVVGDSLVLGLTTLALRDGPCPELPRAHGDGGTGTDSGES